MSSEVAEGAPLAPRATTVRAVGDRKVVVGFTDGTHFEVDLTPLLAGPVFEPIRSDPDRFAEVRVAPGFGAVEWPGGADIDPDVLYAHARAHGTPAS